MIAIAEIYPDFLRKNSSHHSDNQTAGFYPSGRITKIVRPSSTQDKTFTGRDYALLNPFEIVFQKFRSSDMEPIMMNTNQVNP